MNEKDKTTRADFIRFISAQQVEKAIEGLCELKVKTDSDIKPSYGICEALEIASGLKIAYALVGSLSITWSKHSGDNAYPVKGKVEFDRVYDSYDNKSILWTGESKVLRLELIDHLIRELEGIKG